MAKKKGKPNGRRGNTTPPQLPLASLPFRIPQFAVVEPKKPKPQLQSDRRRYNPTRSIAPLNPKHASRIVVKTAEKTLQNYRRLQLLKSSPIKSLRRKAGISTLSERLAFNLPKRLELCIRRKIRSQVMHAKKHAGKTGQKRPVRNFWSKISC